MTIEPENYLDIENNPTWHGIKEMYVTLDDMVQYCRLVRKGHDRSLPLELREQAIKEASDHIRIAMFCSAPGVGKTYLGRKIFKKSGLRVPKDETNPANVRSLAY